MDQSSYIEAVQQVLDQLLAESPRVKAARLGAVLKDRDLDWSEHGFERLKDVLLDLSAVSEISFGPDEKDALAVWRGEFRSIDPDKSSTHQWSTKSLKKPVWTAFVSESTPPPRAIDRLTGTVWLSTSEPPRTDGEWITVNPIPRDTQIEWAREFMASESLTAQSELVQALENEAWFRDFPDSLDRLNADLRRSWNRARTRRVGEWVVNWCHEHSVSPRLLFDERERLSPATVSHRGGQDHLREALIAAVQDLTTEQLLELQLPAATLVRALRPDLLR